MRGETTWLSRKILKRIATEAWYSSIYLWTGTTIWWYDGRQMVRTWHAWHQSSLVNKQQLETTVREAQRGKHNTTNGCRDGMLPEFEKNSHGWEEVRAMVAGLLKANIYPLWCGYSCSSKYLDLWAISSPSISPSTFPRPPGVHNPTAYSTHHICHWLLSILTCHSSPDTSSTWQVFLQ